MNHLLKVAFGFDLDMGKFSYMLACVINRLISSLNGLTYLF